MEKETFRDEIRQRIRSRIKERLEGKEEIILLSQDGCSACKMVKEFVGNAIKMGKVRIIDIDTEEGDAIMNELNISTVPAPVIKESGAYNELDLKEFMSRFGNEDE